MSRITSELTSWPVLLMLVLAVLRISVRLSRRSGRHAGSLKDKKAAIALIQDPATPWETCLELKRRYGLEGKDF